MKEDEQFRYSDGTFVCSSHGSILVGHADHQRAMWRLPLEAGTVISKLWAGATLDSLLNMVSPASRRHFESVLNDMVSEHILVSVDDSRQSLRAKRTPRFELARSIRPFSDLAVRDAEFDSAVWRHVKDYTLTSPAVGFALYCAIRYVLSNDIDGSFVECGVGSGGSSMLMARTAMLNGPTQSDRCIWMYDTFEWSWESPSPADRYGVVDDGILIGAVENMDVDHDELVVRDRVASMGFGQEHIRTVRGMVQDTLRKERPASVSVLRLDTDFYESTKVELEHLYDLVTVGGVVIVDDYGKYGGSTNAVNEFLEERQLSPLLGRTDAQGVMWIKSQ